MKVHYFASCSPRRSEDPKAASSSSTDCNDARSAHAACVPARWRTHPDAARCWPTCLIGGILKTDLSPLPRSSLRWEHLTPDDFLLTPLPNHLFQRDNSAWIYGGVTINPMAMPARQRESVHMPGHLQLPPDVRAARTSTIWYGGDDARTSPPRCEGGDIHVIGNGAVLIGMGERTTPQGVENLARRLFASGARQQGHRRRAAASRARSCTSTP